VLLVEDNATHRLLAAALLQHRGCAVTFAVDGVEALRRFETGVFDLVMMDLQMPRMDGFEATRLIRSREAEGDGPRVPVLAVTSLSAPEDRARAFEAGVDEYIGKPMQPSQLDAAIARLLDRGTDEYDRALALDHASGDVALLDSIVRLFLDETPEHLVAIHHALDSRDAVSLGRHAHGIEDAAQALAMPRLRDLARRIADHSASGEFDQAESVTRELESAFDRTRSAVQRSLGGA
jgi:CheY-like chemotaxis protein